MLKDLLKKISSLQYQSILIKGYIHTTKGLQYNSTKNCCIQNHYGKEKNTYYFEKKLSNGIKDIIVVQDIKIIHILLLNDFLIYIQEYDKLISVKSIKDINQDIDETLDEYNNLIKESKENILIIANHISENIPTEPRRSMLNLYESKSLKIKRDKLNKYTIFDNFGLYSNQEKNFNEIEIIYGNLYKRQAIDVESLEAKNYKMFTKINNSENFNKVNLSFIHEANDIFFEYPNLIEMNFNNTNTYYLIISSRKILKYNKKNIQQHNKENEFDMFDEDYIFDEYKYFEYKPHVIIFKKNNKKNDNIINLTKEIIFSDVENYKIIYKSKNIDALDISNFIELFLEKDRYLQEKWVNEMYKTSLTTEARERLGVSESGDLNEGEIKVVEMFHYE